MNRLHNWQPLPAGAGTQNVVAKANELLLKGKADAAVSFIRNFGGPDMQPAAHALLANEHIKNEKEWLKQLNLYLDQYKVLPLQLKPGRQPRLFRLSAHADYSIDDGPLVTIIMAAYNAERTIEMAVRSILAQTWRRFELFVVDDRSTDKTPEILNRLALEDPRVTVLRNPVNVGPYVSRNRVLQIARGSYVTCHDADDWAFPQRIEMQVEAMRAGELGALTMRCVRMDETGKISRIGNEDRRTHDGILRTCYASGFFDMVLMREKLGYWDSVRFDADTEMLIRTSLAVGSGIRDIFRACEIYYVNPDSLTNNPETGTLDRGTSPVRTEYRNSWRDWHRSLARDSVYLALGRRPFPAPGRMLVSREDIDACIEASPTGS